MSFERVAVVLFALCLVSSSVWASSGAPPAQTSNNLAHFETICLKSDRLCNYSEFNFSSNGNVEWQAVMFVPIASAAEAALWNRKAAEQHVENPPGARRGVAIFEGSSHTWKSVQGDSKCPLCIPKVVPFGGSSRQWFRITMSTDLSWRLRDAAWIFTRIVSRDDKKREFVVVNSHGGPQVCASARSSGMHYQYSTAKSGTFRIILDSDWVGSSRPDYFTISPVCLWSELARAYTRMQGLALAGSDKLPTFTGTIEQRVDAAASYIETLGVQYDATLDKGGYPHQTVADILKARRTDCKGYTTLLYALLRKSGIGSDPVIFNASGMTPMSFSVPDHWSNHVMLYVPAIGRYIDLTVSVPSHDEYTWRTSADSYAGDVVLDTVTGKFAVVP